MDETQTIMIKGQTLIILLMSLLELLHQLLEVGIRTVDAFQTLNQKKNNNNLSFHLGWPIFAAVKEQTG